ncbi:MULTISPECIES: LysR family transcriptional regulator [unclassified Halomonas]|uniref:LysR family transcriptional regulator n=1 Tax=unclassified Halomonas TaxID=2609666 RepID=UPI0012A90EDD|nr:LysR family transcriptional regulator [Halomonas sp. THAF12]QFT83821.1 HTH-type transcriptional regulator YofA [Halomonas sp. THAF12]
MFDFKELEAFVWIVRLGSFRLAAHHLHLTQPSVSDRIGKLEALIGERLLERSQRPVKPTAKGRQFYRHAEQLLEARQQALTMLELETPFQGTLRLGVVETVAHSWLPDFLAELARRFPEMTLELEVDRSPGLADKLAQHDIDLAFLMGPVNIENVLNRYLCHYTMGLVASPALGFDPAFFSLPRLGQTPLITFARHTRPYHELGSLLHQQGIDDVKLHCSSSLWTIVRMTLDGLGIGAIPPRIVKEELASGALVQLPCQLPALTFTACWPQHLDGTLAEGVTELAIEIAQRDQAAHEDG